MNRIFGMVCGCLLIFGFLSAEISAAYVVCERDGCLAVEDTDSKTVERTETRTDCLPRSDRQRLRRGIVCRTRQELARCLEDYSS